MRHSLAYLIIILSISKVFAQTPPTWTTSDKQTFTSVKVLEVQPDAVTIMHSDGVCRVDISTLPPDIQKQFHYDPEAAKKAADERTAQDQQEAEEVASQSQPHPAPADDGRQTSIAAIRDQIKGLELQIVPGNGLNQNILDKITFGNDEILYLEDGFSFTKAEQMAEIKYQILTVLREGTMPVGVNPQDSNKFDQSTARATQSVFQLEAQLENLMNGSKG